MNNKSSAFLLKERFFASLKYFTQGKVLEIYLRMNVEPATSVDKFARVTGSVVTGGTGDDTEDVELTRREQVHAGDGLVSDGDLALDSVGVEALEAWTVVEKSGVRSAHRELNAVELGNSGECSDCLLQHILIL